MSLEGAEQLQVVADQVAVLAPGAGYEDGAAVVAFFRDLVRGARAAGDAGEGELVVRAGGGLRGRLLLGGGCWSGGF